MTGISVFEVIGPNMVGPSSSHTAGAVSMALLARKMFKGNIKQVEYTLYGSFAKTYKGHGTDKALVGGILGFETDDLRIRDSFALAEQEGIAFSFLLSEEEDMHPNTADIMITGANQKKMFLRGISLGGGKVKIVRLNKIEVDFTGEYTTLIVSQIDKQGVAAHITKCLSDNNVNIAYMRLFRKTKGGEAYAIVESDGKIPEKALHVIKENPFVLDVMLVEV